MINSFYNICFAALRRFFYKSKGAKIKNRYNQVPHLTQDANGKETNSQLDTTGQPFQGYQWERENSQLDTPNESQEVSPKLMFDEKMIIIISIGRLYVLCISPYSLNFRYI